MIKSYKKFKKLNADFLIPVLKKEKTSKRFFYINNKGFLRETKIKKKKLYQDSGQFYWGTNKSFMQYNSPFEGNSVSLNISKRNGIDVNTYKDWKQLTKLYNSRNE